MQLCATCKNHITTNDGTNVCIVTLPSWLIDALEKAGIDINRKITTLEDGCDLGGSE